MSGETFLYLETRGRKSGQPRRIEIWFAEVAGRFYIVAELRERAQWVQNLRADTAVRFAVGSRADPAALLPWTAAHARVVDTAREVELATQAKTAMQAKYEWSDGLLVEIMPLR